jgi:N-acetylmuramoyl-L-alanine amidase
VRGITGGTHAILIGLVALIAGIGVSLGVAAAETTGTLGRTAAATLPPPSTITAASGPVGGAAPVKPVAGSVAVALDPKITGDSNRLRFELQLDRAVPVSAFALAEPYRVVVDLPEVVFPAGSGGKPAAALVSGWRAGLFMTGRSRIVFDTAAPTRITQLAVVPLAAGGVRVDLVLEKVAREAFRAGETVTAAGLAAATVPVVASPAAKERPAVGKADREAVRPPAEPGAPERRIVVLDPGHGGIDPGTRSPATGLVEKTVVLEFAKLFKQKLEATGRYTVFLTRSDDTFIPLAERVRIARRDHADVFVSIHADAEFDHSVRGATVYTVADKGSDDKSEALAAKENASDAVAGVVPEASADEVADILLDLTRRETRLLNQTLAGALVNGLGQVGKLVGGTGHRSASFRVLKAYDVPSVLIEIGFITNRDDEAQMTSAAWRDKTATALVTSIDRYFAERVAGGR